MMRDWRILALVVALCAFSGVACGPPPPPCVAWRSEPYTYLMPMGKVLMPMTSVRDVCTCRQGAACAKKEAQR